MHAGHDNDLSIARVQERLNFFEDHVNDDTKQSRCIDYIRRGTYCFVTWLVSCQAVSLVPSIVLIAC
jgi:hypothetical protein